MSNKYQDLAEGKTKLIVRVEPEEKIITARLGAKDDITAGDGVKHDILPGKAELATTTTCNVFGLLKACGQPVAFYRQDSPTSFLAPYCRMLKWEVVVRRRARGSILKRRRELKEFDRFDPLLVEFYLKTSDKIWKSFPLECDDPLAEFLPDGSVLLWKPSKAYVKGTHFLKLRKSEVYDEPGDATLISEMTDLAVKGFLILERAWAMVGGTLDDYKAEFGIDENGRLLMADVLDNDSWRLRYAKFGSREVIPRSVDKQVYRDGGDLKLVLKNYQLVAKLTEAFPGMHTEIKTWFEARYS
jgi:phosphoribosylaminoimidazole carboxylase/phosphoribosylaminoimidazole-succinocarboxamide synthase